MSIKNTIQFYIVCVIETIMKIVEKLVMHHDFLMVGYKTGGC